MYKSNGAFHSFPFFPHPVVIFPCTSQTLLANQIASLRIVKRQTRNNAQALYYGTVRKITGQKYTKYEI